MKNIFKSLMLVAVAATAFTACEKDNNEANKVDQKTVINGVATIDNDTRSGFGDKVGSAYTSKWDGGEKIIVFAGDQSVTTTVDSEGHFTATFEGEVDAITVCSPADQWSDAYNRTVPTEQTPLAATVDPAAHILKGEAAVANGSAAVAMQHAVAYGKMTVNTPAEFEIDYVELTVNTYTTYTINADEVQDNVFWFAAHEFVVNSFEISAYNADGEVYTKSVSGLPAEGQGSLSFKNGRVSTFSVSDLEKQEEDAGVKLTKASGSINAEWVSYGKQCYGINFYNEDETFNVWVSVNTETNSLEAATYSTENSEYYIRDYRWTGVSYFWSLEMDVKIVDGLYNITFSGIDWNTGEPHTATFVGEIDGFVLPSTDPYMELSVNELTFTAAIGFRTITVKTKNTTEAINATSDNTHFDVSVDGNIVTVVAAENTTSDPITGTITITCGALTETVAVKQLGSTAGAVQDGSQAHPYIYTCVVSDGGSFYVLIFNCEAAGVKPLYMESNNKFVSPFKSGAINTDNNWYPTQCRYGSGADLDCANSYITIEHISDKELCFSEMRLRIAGEDIYFKCESVVFP